MNTPTEQVITPQILQRFVHPTHEVLKNILWVHHHRGDYTESGNRRLRALVGDAAYETIHWDTLVSNGSVALYLPRVKIEGGVEAPFGFGIGRAEHLWAMSEIDERSPEVTEAQPDTLMRYAPETLAMLRSTLPGFEAVEVANVNFFEHGSGPVKKRSKPAPRDVLFFRFTGGYGMAMPRKAGAS